MQANVICKPGDKIKVFWLAGQIYEAKIIKQEAPPPGQNWPNLSVHFLVSSLKETPIPPPPRQARSGLISTYTTW